MSDVITMRAECSGCGGTTGEIRPKSGQDCVYCCTCNTWQYNAPRLETGRAVRSLSTRPGITPAQRARVLAVHDHACIGCGKRPPDVALDIDHILGREIAFKHGLLDELIDSEWNLAPMCQECNSGKRWVSEPEVRLMYRVLMLKAMPR